MAKYFGETKKMGFVAANRHRSIASEYMEDISCPDPYGAYSEQDEIGFLEEIFRLPDFNSSRDVGFHRFF